ncbi:hypothetical protein HJC10_31390 [Corallococcus exiguus]|uniref:hypothetical protein n=1 Tax=Corallococcus exiguus TaxID=83462 RepID=UPI0014713540|nr:hypothetical protein [Corallococcus exiguus]NNB98774.1 hypothetical protein [Corallococcus exiguus]NNC07339.1 hypothetical protein [Corallococcus exiguus]NPC51451.1 hypothetical protein [Corallococcus exiguus]
MVYDNNGKQLVTPAHMGFRHFAEVGFRTGYADPSGLAAGGLLPNARAEEGAFRSGSTSARPRCAAPTERYRAGC